MTQLQTSTSVRFPQYADTCFLCSDDESPCRPASAAAEFPIFDMHHLTQTSDGLLGVVRYTRREHPVFLVLLDDEVEGV